MNPDLKLNMSIRTVPSPEFDTTRNVKQYDHVITVDGREIVIPWKKGVAIEHGTTNTWYVLRTQNVIFRKGDPMPAPGDIVIFVTTDLKTFLMRNHRQQEWSYVETFVPYIVISRFHMPKHGYRFLLTMICAIELVETQAHRYVEVLI